MAFHGIGSLYSLMGASSFLGVDIFFVISGFVIARLAFAELQKSGSFNWGKFFLSRTLRITPAIFVMLSFYALFNPFNRPEELNLLAIAIAALNLADYDIALGLGHMSCSGLEMCWSLAVEEKFYLFFPLMMLLCKRFRSSLVFAGLIGTAELWRFFVAYHCGDIVRVHGAFDTRLDEILIGCFAASLLRQKSFREKSKWLAHPLVSASLLCATWVCMWFWMWPMTVSWTLEQKKLYFLTSIPLFATIISLLLISLTLAEENNRPIWLGKLLGSFALIWIGRLSYSMYLWHTVAFLAARTALGDSGILSDLAKASLTIVLALVSYFLIEKPFLTLKQRMTGNASSTYTSTAEVSKKQVVVS